MLDTIEIYLVAWLLGSALAGTSMPTLGKEVRNSKVLLGVARALPDQADTWFADFSSVLAQNDRDLEAEVVVVVDTSADSDEAGATTATRGSFVPPNARPRTMWTTRRSFPWPRR